MNIINVGKSALKINDDDFILVQGNALRVLKKIAPKSVDVIFADPPYFLSNDGVTCVNGKMVSVNKALWDKSISATDKLNFNRKWIRYCRDALKDDGTIWISGTMHNIFSVYRILTDLGFKILNTIIWKKTNPPPCFSCRFFTSSTEIILWARKQQKVGHTFNYDLMKAINGGKQMKDVWELPAIARWEKAQGKHPTQKPLSVVSRTILASTHRGALVVDPFAGSSTTGVAAYLFNRKYVGIDTDSSYLDLSVARYKEAIEFKETMAKKIYGIDCDVVSKYDV